MSLGMGHSQKKDAETLWLNIIDQVDI